MLPGVTRGTAVVPLQTLVHILSDANVVSCRVRPAPEDVHEPPADAVHARDDGAPFAPARFTNVRAGRALKSAEFAYLARWSCCEFGLRRSAFALRGFGETAFAVLICSRRARGLETDADLLA